MSDQIRFGVVGARNIGKGHMRNCLKHPAATLVAVADTSQERLDECRAEFGSLDAYTDAAELFAREGIDAVVLALPNQLHEPLTVQALEAGKHVLIEKPMARGAAECERMIAARDRSGKQLMVGMNQRFNPTVAALRASIADGAIGTYQFGHTYWDLDRPFEGLWGRGDWFLGGEASGGGPLIDLGIHRLDLAMHLLGFPRAESVMAFCGHGIGQAEAARRGKPYGIEDSGLGFIRFADGSAMTLEASYFLNTPMIGQETMLYGDAGYLHLPLSGDPVLMSYPAGGEPKPLPIVPDDAAATTCLEHFVRVLLGEEELSSTAEQGLAGMRIIEAMYESARTGQAVQL